MFGFNNTLGVTIDKTSINNLKDENKLLVDIYLKICEAIVDKDISTLKLLIPEKSINHIIGDSKLKKQWLEDIEKETIKYYGIEILKIKVVINKEKATIKAINKIRAKLYEYRGCWTVDSYLSLEKENDKWIAKEILI